MKKNAVLALQAAKKAGVGESTVKLAEAKEAAALAKLFLKKAAAEGEVEAGARLIMQEAANDPLPLAEVKEANTAVAPGSGEEARATGAARSGKPGLKKRPSSIYNNSPSKRAHLMSVDQNESVAEGRKMSPEAKATPEAAQALKEAPVVAVEPGSGGEVAAVEEGVGIPNGYLSVGQRMQTIGNGIGNLFNQTGQWLKNAFTPSRQAQHQ